MQELVAIVLQFKGKLPAFPADIYAWAEVASKGKH